jgi:KaiC/GvpD/RAD55 family RecA-like ATPase
MNYSELDVSELDQDKILVTMVCDTNFLAKCIRKRIKPQYFSGAVRQAVSKLVFNFFNKYDKAPKENITDLIADSMTKGLANKADMTMFEQYLSKIFGIDDSDINHEYLLDCMDWFIKRRLALTTINELNKMKTRLDTDPDRLLNVMREAITELDVSVGKQMIELFSETPVMKTRSDIATRFGIDIIDEALGGGFQIPNFVVIQGYIGRGKTWCISHLAKMAARYGESSLVIINEASNKMFRRRLYMSMTGTTKDELNDSLQSIIQQSKRALIKKSDIILLNEEEKGMCVDDLPNILSEVATKSARRKDVKLILIDSADDFLPPKGGKYRTGIEKSTAIYTWLKNYSKDNGLCIVTTSQSKRIGETAWWLTSGTIGDDINKVRKATLGISINATDQEVELGISRILVFKNTDGPTGAKAWIANDFSRGQFCTNSGRYDYTEYKEMLKELGSHG